MNRAEFEAWKQHTESNRWGWTLDPVHNGINTDDYLFHRGGVNGQYIVVEDGLATIGWYNGALPHIGEAEFQPEYENSFDSNDDAFFALIHKGGLTFLEDYIIIREEGPF